MIDIRTVQNKLQGAIKDGDRIASSDRTALGSANRNYIVPAAGGFAAIAILAVTVLPFVYGLFKIGTSNGRPPRPGDDRRDIKFTRK